LVFVDHGMFAVWRDYRTVDRCVTEVAFSGEISYDVGGSIIF
jgi:hypothetical protein